MAFNFQSLKDAIYDYIPTFWRAKVDDPEGDNSSKGTKFTPSRANNIETGIDKAHERITQIVEYLEGEEQTIKKLFFEFLLLKASVTSGLTTNILSEDFSNANSFNLKEGVFDAQNKRIYLPQKEGGIDGTLLLE